MYLCSVLSQLLLSLYELAKSTKTTPNKAEVISSNPPSPSCANMSKKKSTITKICKVNNINVALQIDHWIFFYLTMTNLRVR